MSRRQMESFSVQQFYKNAAEVWASSPHLRSKLDFASCFPCCNCIFWSCPMQTKLYHENQGCKFRQGNGAIAVRWQAKAGVEPPFAGWERPFSLRAMFHVKQYFWKTICVWFGKAGAHPQLALGIAIAPETLFFHYNLLILKGNCDFLRFLLDFCCSFIVQFCYLLRKRGLLAHTSPTFLKNCWIKKLFFACGLVFAANVLKNSLSSWIVSRETVFMLQL